MAPSSPKPRSDAGFTLIELLVAMSMLALTSALILTSVTTVRRSLRAIEDLTQKAQTGIVQEFIAELLSSVRPVRHVPEQNEVVMSGSINSMTFVSEMSAGGATGGLYVFTLSHQAEDRYGPARLVLHHRLYRRAREDGGVEYSKVLLDAVEGVKFSYYDRGTSRWRDTWTGADFLPDLIKIEIRFLERDIRKWGEMIARPRGTAN